MKCPHCGSSELIKNGIRNNVQRYQCRLCNRYFQEGSTPKQLTKSIKNMGITEEQFRKKHDVVFILGQTMERLEEGVLYEKSDVIKLANLSPGYPGISTVLDSEHFKKFVGKAGSTAYWAKPELITKLKEEGIMR